MQENEKNLIEQFKIISNKKWIKTVSHSFGGVGLTFEKELKKKPDSMYFPDYCGIEIKCTSRYSNYPLFLLTIAFDGPNLSEMHVITDKYGYPDKMFPDKKVLFEKISCVDKKVVNGKWKFKLDVDYNEEKIYLCVYDLYDKLIERTSFVYFDSIRNHLLLKLNKLAVVYASRKVIDSEVYFRYYQMDLFNLIGFDQFIKLLEVGIINVDLIARISKSGNDIGRYCNKNLVFSIKKPHIDMLFKKFYSYNADISRFYEKLTFYNLCCII